MNTPTCMHLGSGNLEETYTDTGHAKIHTDSFMFLFSVALSPFCSIPIQHKVSFGNKTTNLCKIRSWKHIYNRSIFVNSFYSEIPFFICSWWPAREQRFIGLKCYIYSKESLVLKKNQLIINNIIKYNDSRPFHSQIPQYELFWHVTSCLPLNTRHPTSEKNLT